MTDYDKLITQLESLNFKREDFKDMYRYTKYYNGISYTFMYYTNKEINMKNIFHIYKISDYKKINDLKSFKDALDYLNTEFRHVLRKRKIAKLL